MKFKTGVVAASLLVACGTDNAIVGGECADGYTRIGGTCTKSAPSGSQPSADDDAGATNGGDAGPLTDAGTTPADDASTPNEDASTADDAGTQNDAGPDEDASTPNDAGTEPDAPVCAAPKMECGAAGCVDVRTNVEHCGGCNVFCASGRCIDGICEGALAGHAVLIGHDYVAPLASDTYLSSQERLLGNAALLAPSRTVRVVTIETYADANAATNVRTILMRAAAETGRPLELRTTDDPGSVQRADADVVLMLDQVSAAGRFASRAAAARDPLGRFLDASGVVIVLDGASAGTEMVSFVRDAGLFDVAGHVAPSGLFFVDARDALGYGVAAPYAARAHATAFGFGGPAPAGVWITVTDDRGAPVVLHSAHAPR